MNASAGGLHARCRAAVAGAIGLRRNCSFGKIVRAAQQRPRHRPSATPHISGGACGSRSHQLGELETGAGGEGCRLPSSQRVDCGDQLSLLKIGSCSSVRGDECGLEIVTRAAGAASDAEVARNSRAAQRKTSRASAAAGRLIKEVVMDERQRIPRHEALIGCDVSRRPRGGPPLGAVAPRESAS